MSKKIILKFYRSHTGKFSYATSFRTRDDTFFYLRRFVYCIVRCLLQCSFTKTEMRFRRKKLLDNPYTAFPYFVSTAHEKAFPDLRIFLRLYGPMHSRIAFLADSYVAMLHNRYVRTYIHTYVYGSYVSNQLRSGNS